MYTSLPAQNEDVSLGERVPAWIPSSNLFRCPQAPRGRQGDATDISVYFSSSRSPDGAARSGRAWRENEDTNRAGEA